MKIKDFRFVELLTPTLSSVEEERETIRESIEPGFNSIATFGLAGLGVPARR